MSKDLINLSQEDLEKQLLDENDPSRVKEILDIFNMHLKKKEAIRTNQLSNLQDKIFKQMDQRLNEKANNFSNSDLITYYKTIQDSLSKADTNLDNISIPQIQVNQQINVVGDSVLDRNSRQKVLQAVKSILGKTLSESSVEEDQDILYNNNEEIIHEEQQ